MKKFFYLSLAAAAMLAAGCSKEMADVDTVANGSFDPNGTGFVKVNIAFPSSASTKANDDFADGLANEYAVENVTLVLFSGPSTAAENDLVLRSAYNLGQGAWDGGSTSQITVERSIVAEIEKTGMAADDQIWALVILNHHEFCEVRTSAHSSNLPTLWAMVDGTETELTGKTFGFVRNITLNETNRRFDTHSFFMSNMPYSSKPGGANNPNDPAVAEVRTLYKLDSSKIVLDRTAAATGDPAAEVNVERALAKVDVNWDPSLNKTSDENHYSLQVLGWFIDNTNPKTYCMRHVEEEAGLGYLGYRSAFYTSSFGKPYRFVASDPVCGHQIAYRPYWAVDPNYDVPAAGLTNKGGKYVDNTIMKYEGDIKISGDLRPNGTAYYCTENTFDIAHQSVSNTTRVIVATRFNEGDDFYTINVENGRMFKPADARKYAVAAIMNRVSTKIWIQDNFKAEAYTGDNDGSQLFTCTITVNSEGAGLCTVVVTPAEDTVLNTWKRDSSKDVTVIRGEFAQDNNNQYLASNFIFNLYKGGIAYYQALIRHFNEDETPWTPTGTMTNSTSGVYGTDSASYLGRYGVVRNNWYSITLGGIRQIGSAVVPPVDPTQDPDIPDDQVVDYLKVKINVMPWSMRFQSVIL